MSDVLTAVEPLTSGRRMHDKVCLVTGGGSGIGRATALKLAQESALAVIVAGRREAELEVTAVQCRAAGAEALAVKTDVTREDEIESLVRAALNRYGRLDVAFNNAGYQERRAPLEQQGAAVYNEVFDANVRSVFLCLRAQLAPMLARGQGRIVVNASVSGIRNPNTGLALYSASKAAVISLTRSAAMEAAPRGVRINAIAPGRVVTDMMLRAGVGDVATVAAGLPLRRTGQPEDIAEAVVWLASDASSYVVGHVLAADGGFLAS
jgi:NAD(P)-dependent dehydrogenase (short-subunit alcohol dehydrogenase family)